MGTPVESHDLTPFDISSALAMELASQLTPPMEVFRRHGLSEQDAKVLLKDEKFQQLLKQSKAEWNAESNTADRIRLKAQMCLEQLLMPMFQTASNPQVPVPARNETTKIIERIAGVSNKEDGGGNGAVFKLTINLGSEDRPKEIQGHVIDNREE